MYMPTKAQKRVLDELVKGKSNPEIAKALCIAVGSVEDHLYDVKKRLGLKNTRGLVVWWLRIVWESEKVPV